MEFNSFIAVMQIFITLYKANQLPLLYNTLILLERSKTCREALAQRQLAFFCVTILPLQAYVFVVGGGNYIEYQNLLEYCRRGQGIKNVTYGTSELMNASQFLSQVGLSFSSFVPLIIVSCLC